MMRIKLSGDSYSPSCLFIWFLHVSLHLDPALLQVVLNSVDLYQVLFLLDSLESLNEGYRGSALFLFELSNLEKLN